jgi:NADH-quinone oxidoreductase subunit I
MASYDGRGILKGMGVTLKRFVDTYLDDIKWFGKRYYTEEGVAHRMSSDARGIFTIQYPEEKLPVPEEFRFIPILIYDELEGDQIKIRCTSCGICAKVCPPQCIWIVRTTDPETKRPVPEPKEFYIDVDICMNCGFCAEYCPFDAIKIQHHTTPASVPRTTKMKNKRAPRPRRRKPPEKPGRKQHEENNSRKFHFHNRIIENPKCG